jgi:outer membrane protein TolC
MVFDILTKNRRLAHLVIYGLAGLSSLTGCASDPYEYKAEADEKVYGIIEHKWSDDFGSRTNYRVSDVPAGPDDIQIERVVPPDGIFTLPQAVAMATAHSRQYQLERELLYVQALDLNLIQHQYEPNPFATALFGYGEEGPDSATGGNIGAGFSQLLASGAQISAKVGAAWADMVTGDVRSGLSSILAVAITQPLLRGSGRKVALENLTQAERNVLYQIRTFNRFRKTFVVSVISQYYRVLQYLDAVKNAEEYYESLVDLYQQAERLAGAGRLTLLELDRIRQEKLEANYIRIQAQKEYKHALDEFKITLSMPATAELQLDESELEALRKTPLTEPNFAEVEAIETALQARLDLANRIDAVDDAERKVAVAIDSLRAQLDLVASTGRVSDDLTDFTNLRNLEDESQVALALDLPLDRTVEQNVYRKALISLNQRKREREEASDLVALDIRRAYRDLIAASERYGIESEELRLARKRFENSSLLLQYGRASSRRILNAQDDLYDAQNASTEALVNFTIATLNFYRDTGVLQVRPDGMWQRPKGVEEETEPDVLEITEDLFRPETEGRQLDTEEFIDRWMTKTKSEPDDQSNQPAPVDRDAEEYIDQWMKKSKR